MATKNFRYKPGDYVRIPLSNSRNAFMRIFPAPAIGVFAATTPKTQTGLPEQPGKIVLFAHWMANAFRGKPKWEIVCRKPFNNKAEAYVPPFYIGYVDLGYELIFQDKRRARPAAKHDLVGKFPHEMLAPAALIERLNREFRVNSKGKLTPIGKRRFEDREIAWSRNRKAPHKIVKPKPSPEDFSALDFKGKSIRESTDAIVELIKNLAKKRRKQKGKS